jgi:FeS assembly protein IscX
MKWTDSREIAQALAEKHPNIDPNLIRSSQLRVWVMELNQFNDEPDLCNDKILETIQANWIEESADTAEDS